jgi:hypothetical protein
MHVWTDIFIRELVMLILLFALGIGPASFLSTRFDAAARLAMAPVLGLCVGTCVFTTLIWFTAARHTYWLLPILAVVSVVFALRRGLAATQSDDRGKQQSARLTLLLRRLPARDAFALIVVCVVVAAPLNYTLHERHSVGPIGFSVWDAVGYTAEADGMAQQSIRQAERSKIIAGGHNAPEALAALAGRGRRPSGNNTLSQLYWDAYAPGVQNLDAAPLSANVNELIGLHATDTQTLFVITFLVAGALGAFSAVRYWAPRPAWAAALAGILFGGPFFMQLIADGSQAAICGLAVILPLAAVGTDAIRNKTPSSLALVALLASGLLALYPLFGYAVVATAVLLLVVLASSAWWRGRLTRRTLARAALLVGAVIGLIIVLDLVSFTRDLRYWRSVLNGGFYLEGLPKPHLPYSVLPGWLLQTREFYYLTELGSTTPYEILVGVVLPAILIAAIIFGLKRNRAATLLAALLVISVIIAEYNNAAHHCSYCTDRALLPVAPLSIGLLALGIAALVTSSSLLLRGAGVLVALLALVVAADNTRQERIRFSNGSYFLGAGDRALASRLPSNAGPVELEGYGQAPIAAPGELPLAYFMLSERTHGNASLPTEYSDYRGLFYVGEANPTNPQFNPNYRYVLTRLGGLQTGRRVLAATGPLALEERTGLDATVVSGVGVPPLRRSADGLAWVEGPIHMLVVGGGAAPAWISMRFQAATPVSVPPQNGVRTRSWSNGVLAACVRATGTAPVRKATIVLSFAHLPMAAPLKEAFAQAEPVQRVQLLAVRAVDRCSLSS